MAQNEKDAWFEITKMYQKTTQAQEAAALRQLAKVAIRLCRDSNIIDEAVIKYKREIPQMQTTKEAYTMR